MLFSLGGGAEGIEPSADARASADRLAAVVDGPGTALDPLARPGAGFGHLTGPRPDAPVTRDLGARLDALADALVEAEGDPAEADSDLAPLWPLFGRFLDHDLAAPQSAEPRRPGAVALLANRRCGRLRLDSLYRADAGEGPLADKLTRLMREPGAPSRMRLDVVAPSDLGRVRLPRDGGADLLRLGRLLADDPAEGVTPAEIAAAPAALRDRLAPGGRIDPRRAVIGEARNDDSLLIAQLHLALLRFHNRVSDWTADTGAAAPEALFRTSRDLTRRHLQWLALNDYLPRLCDRAVLDRVRRAGAPLHARLRARMGAGGPVPVPLEHWAAAARYRQTVMRARWDLNRFWGRPDPTAAQAGPACRRAGLDHLLRWTGAQMPTARLPAHVPVDWARLSAMPPAFRDRGARRIDTFVTPPFGEADPVVTEANRRLARLTLRRGHCLGLPSGQEAAAAFNAVYDDLIRPLGPAALTGGHTGEAVRDGLTERTPLWFYILKEAEVQTGGRRLGQLGSAILAETLIGALIADPKSVWHAPGRFGGPWTPMDGACPDGLAIDELPALLAAADLL